ncbi:MAG: cysteine desulfurase [Clostridia bacterium]|nr:cysteine desulfurase [Clostridia bacterium]
MIYLDNAATTRIDEEVLAVMTPFLRENFGNTQSQHSYGRAAANALTEVRDKIAALLSCKPEEIYFVSGGTEAGNTALKGVCAERGKGHLIVSAIEHPALLESAEDMRKLGFTATFLNPDKNGRIEPESVAAAIREDTVFCAVMAANNETGVIQPVKEIGEICKARGVFYYADCVQSACTQPLPTGYCDAFGISAHKFYGPKGAGAIYIKSGSKISRLISGGRQERGLRGGTVNTAAAIGLAKAFELACKERENSAAYLAKLRDKFLSRVFAEIDGTHLNGGGEILPSHANISFDGCEGENILFYLDLNGVAVSTGSACSAGAVTPSRALMAAGLSESRAKSAVRFTFGKYNTFEEVDNTVEILKRAVAAIRK